MHEGSIAMNIIEFAKKIANENSIKKILDIEIVCGKLHAVVPDALKFFFDILKKDEELLNESRLIIHEEDVIVKCLDCKKEFLSEINYFKCPGCDSTNTKIIKGDHIFITSIKGE